MILRFKLLVVIVALLAACSNRAGARDDFLIRNIVAVGETYNYRVFVPRERDPNSKIPVMLYLHGSNRRGDDNEAQLLDLGDVIQDRPQNFPFVIVFPQCRRNAFWAGAITTQAIAALDQTVREFNGDPNKLYLAGYSMGGFGTWQMAVTFPEKFAAIVPVAGGIEPVGEPSDEDRALLSPQVRAAAESSDPYQAFAGVLKRTPAWVVHGSKDEAVPVEGARKIVSALKAAGNANVHYVELDGVGHGSVQPAFTNPQLFEWLAKQNRNEPK